MLIVVMMGQWSGSVVSGLGQWSGSVVWVSGLGQWSGSDDIARLVVHDVRLYSVDTVVICGDDGCCSVVFGNGYGNSDIL